ncbi:MAG: META domain-containing protein [Adhaeribacter sp.]
MKNSGSISLLILVLFSLLVIEACQKETEKPEALLQKWQVVSMRRPNSASQQYPVKPYILQFKKDKSLTFKLDVNNCDGAYTVSQPGQIKIERLAYTEICCDSDIAQELASLLHHVNTYQIQADILTLNGLGELKLKRIK